MCKLLKLYDSLSFFFFREAAFHELGVYSKNHGNAVGLFSPENVRIKIKQNN